MAAHQSVQPLPGPTRATALAAAAQDRQPRTSHLVHETANPVTIARHGMIIQPALYNASKPAGRFAKRPVPALSQLLLDRLQRCTQTLRHTVTLDGARPCRPGLAALVSEAQRCKKVPRHGCHANTTRHSSWNAHRPRPPRADEARGLHHALNRGNLRATIFHKEEDFEAFERILFQALQMHKGELFSFQRMPNHYHLVPRPRVDNEVSRFMGWIGGTHTMRYHAHDHTSGMGHVYQQRDKSFPIRHQCRSS